MFFPNVDQLVHEPGAQQGAELVFVKQHLAPQPQLAKIESTLDGSEMEQHESDSTTVSGNNLAVSSIAAPETPRMTVSNDINIINDVVLPEQQETKFEGTNSTAEMYTKPNAPTAKI